MNPNITARILRKIANRIDNSKNPDRAKVAQDIQSVAKALNKPSRRLSSDYLDSAKGQKITKDRALKELDEHGVPETERSEFFSEVGDHDEYDAQEVLHWLGY